MPDHRLPMKVLFGELHQGKHSLGCPKKCFKDTVKAFLKAFNISHMTWEQIAEDRDSWRAAVHQGAKSHEANRIAAAEQCREARKNSANRSPAAATIPCPHCQRTFQTQIGLISHLRTCRAQPQDD